MFNSRGKTNGLWTNHTPGKRIVPVTTPRSRELRKKIFAFFLVVYFLGNGAVDYFNLANEILVLYIVELVVCGVCAVLYLWWWLKEHHPASDVYRCVTLLFCGLSIRLMTESYVRWIYLVQGELDYKALICSYMWRLRILPESVALLYMLSLVLGRVISGHEEQQQ
jgi:hypothetical protein